MGSSEMTCKACPFCGVQLKELVDGIYQHPYSEGYNKRNCFILAICKETVQPKQMNLWNARAPSAATVCHYEVVDGLPVFNEDGRGYPATTEFLNACFEYLRANNPWG